MGLQEVSAGGLVFRGRNPEETEILLIRDRYGWWTLPKGHVEPEESPREAAVREIFEETGIEGEVVAVLPAVQYTFWAQGRRIEKNVHYYLVRATGGRAVPQIEEIDQVRWYRWETVAELKQYPNNRPILAAARQLLLQGAGR